MANIFNTKKSPNPEWLRGGNPSAIEEQEAKGQKELCASSQLPTEGAEVYEELGIQVIGKSSGDMLFYDVKLPDGWKISPTDHSMWSDLLNESGEKMGSIFYKAAFYDRKAFFTTL